MKKNLSILAFVFGAIALGHTQAAPSATGPTKIGLTGELKYSLRYTQITDLNKIRGNDERSVAYGDLAYLNNSERSPFQLKFGAGYGWKESGPSYGEGLFENLYLTQGIHAKNWSLQLADTVGYRKQAPVSGFSGNPGTGEPITEPPPPTNQSIYTVDTTSIENYASATINSRLNHADFFSIGGSSELLRYPDNNGLDTNMESGNATLSHRLNAKNAISGEFIYSEYTFPASGLSFNSNAALAGYQRQLNRKISIVLSAGPQFVHSSNQLLVPDSNGVQASALVTDKLRWANASLSYVHGITGGGGYMLGAKSDSGIGGLQKQFNSKRITIELSAEYRRSEVLSGTGVINSKYGGVLATKRLRKNFTLIASYMAVTQSSSYSLPFSANVLSNLWQVFSAGLAYSPRPVHLRL